MIETRIEFKTTWSNWLELDLCQECSSLATVLEEVTIWIQMLFISRLFYYSNILQEAKPLLPIVQEILNADWNRLEQSEFWTEIRLKIHFEPIKLFL